MRDLEIAGVALIDNVDVMLYSRPGNALQAVKWRTLKTDSQANRNYKVDPNA
jgi:hypothetical protein